MRPLSLLVALLFLNSISDRLFAQATPEKTNGSDRPRRLTYERIPGEHPLKPAILLTREAIKRLEKTKDYSCKFVRQERIGGQLRERGYSFLKIRHEPFSVYAYIQAPLRGSEVIYVAGKNNGQLWAHEVGAGARAAGTLSLDPEGPRAMKESRSPITSAGLLGLARRILEGTERDIQYDECEIKTYSDAKVNSRHCLCVEVTHPVPRREFVFHLARIYFDHEWAIPIRYEAYLWPKKKGGEPELFEEYTYLDISFNNGFTDRDFDITNPEYNFPPER